MKAVLKFIAALIAAMASVVAVVKFIESRREDEPLVRLVSATRNRDVSYPVDPRTMQEDKSKGFLMPELALKFKNEGKHEADDITVKVDKSTVSEETARLWFNIEGDHLSSDIHIPYLMPEQIADASVNIDDYDSTTTHKYSGYVLYRDRVTGKLYRVPWCKLHSFLTPRKDLTDCFEGLEPKHR